VANEIVQGDSGSVLSLTISDDSQIVDLTNATVEVVIKYKATGIVKQATVTNALQGECQITLDASDIPHQGIYSFQATVKFSDGKQFSSQIERFSVSKKMNYVPDIGGGGNTDIGGSTTNGNIIVNGIDIKVYDDSTLRTDISSLKNSKHTHSNLEDLERLGINENNKLTVDGFELVTGGTGTIGIDGKSAYQLWLDQGNTGSVEVFLNSLKGAKGDKGDTGLTGATGQNGLDGERGVDGKSAYQIWLDAGNTGTESDFLLSLKGEKGDSGTGEGTLPSNVIYFEDWLDGETVTIDTGGTTPTNTAPSISSSYSTTNVFDTTSVSIPYTVTDNQGGTITATYTKDGVSNTVTVATGANTWNVGILSAGSHTLSIQVKDSGNLTSNTLTFSITSTVSSDTTAPEPVTALSSGTPTHNSIPVSWTLSSSSDVTNYEIAYSTDGTNYTVSSSVVNASSTSYTVTGLVASTNYTIRVVAIDGAGNRSTAITVSASTSTPADTTVPVLTITPASTFTDSQSVTMSANETADIWYTTDGSDPVSSGTRVKYSAPVTLTATTTVKTYAVDGAGNASTVQTVVYTKETTQVGSHVQDSSLLLFQENPSNDSTIVNPDNYFQGSGDFTTSINAKFSIPSGGTNAATLLLSRLTPNVMKIELTWQHKLTANLYGTSAGSAAYPAVASANIFDDFTKNYHIALVRSGTSLTIYVDDIQIATVAIPADFTFNTSTASLVIGQATKAGTYKNLTYYNRALTTNERTQNYNALK